MDTLRVAVKFSTGCMNEVMLKFDENIFLTAMKKRSGVARAPRQKYWSAVIDPWVRLGRNCYNKRGNWQDICE